MSDPDWPLAKRDPRAFFGLAADASLTDLKRAYARLIKTWKPDKFPSEFKIIRRAYEALESGYQDIDAHGFEAIQDLRPEPAAPTLATTLPPTPRWVDRLHDLGVEVTLAAMEGEPRLDARDWLLLAALREAQQPDVASVFVRCLIEALRHHPESHEIWPALEKELHRDWTAEELETVALELCTLHNHPAFLLRSHAFWYYCLEKLPLTQILPLLDRFLHRSHGRAHQDEARFVLGILLRHGPELPIDWLRLQTAAYKQTWHPALQPLAADLQALPAIRAELEKSSDPAARRLLDFFAAWSRQDLAELHLCRQQFRHFLLHRPAQAAPLLKGPELFLPARRLIAFRCQSLRGRLPSRDRLSPLAPRQWCIQQFSGTLDCLLQSLPISLGVLSVFVMFFVALWASGQVSSQTLSALIAISWVILCPLLLLRFRRLAAALSWRRSPRQILIFTVLLCVGAPLCFLIVIPRVADWMRAWFAGAKQEILSVCWLVFILFLAWLSCLSPSPQWRQDDAQALSGLILVLQYLCLLILSFKRFETFCLDRCARPWYRRRSRPHRGQLALLLGASGLSLERWGKDLNHLQQAHPHLHHFAQAFLDDGDLHLAAAVWEGSRDDTEFISH